MLDIVYEAEDFRVDDVEEKLRELMPYIFSILADNGYDITDYDKLESVLLVHDSLRSAIYDSMDRWHPLQDFAYEAYAKVIDGEPLEPLDFSLAAASFCANSGSED